MNRISLLVATLLAAASPAPAQTAGAVATASATRGEPVRETVTVAADEPIPNVPGKRLVSLVVDYPPGGTSVAHRHSQSAFIYAYVVSGAIRSQVDDEPVRVYRTGEGWFEEPGAHHRISENASDTEPARLLAVFIVDRGDEALTLPATAQAEGGSDVAAD